jgi:nucleotide-binding universal stress UspA family protein
MFKRILTAVDGSPRDAQATALAASLAARGEVQVVLVRVESPLASLAAVLEVSAALERQAAELRAGGLNAYHVIEHGRPEHGVLVAAREEQADLIVVVRRQREGLELLWNPGVTARVLSRSPVPVLIWPAEMPVQSFLEQGPILVPLDGTPTAERALPLAVALASSYRRPLLLLVAPHGRPHLSAGLAAQRLYLATVRARLSAEAAPPIETALGEGAAADAIVWAAEGRAASLIVLCQHGRIGLARPPALGPAGEVARRAPVPLLVVPPRALASRARGKQASRRAPI